MFSSYRLSRIPQDSQLQAWNAADELFMNRCAALDLNFQSTLIVNDSFGALAVALNNAEIDWWNDSAMSLAALKSNVSRNNKQQPNVVSSLTGQKKYESVIIQMPKSLKLFRWQLEQIVKNGSPSLKVYVLCMVKHVGQGHIKAMQSLFSGSNPGKAEKKARVISLTTPASTFEKTALSSYFAPEVEAEFVNLPGCYAENTVDMGARVFIKHFSLLPKANKVLDLGCGNGILSVAYFRQYPETEMYLVDESQQAIDSAKLNLKAFDSNCHYKHSNGLSEFNHSDIFDLILCNPPFHQSTTLTEHIAFGLIKESAQHLDEGGELWLVANRHLDYRAVCNRHFSSTKLRSNDAKFNVIQCIK